MEKRNINTFLKDNILISEFMGLKIINDSISYFDENYKPLKKYHENWNDLMNVVEKIESYGYFVKISTNMCSISRDNKNNQDSHLVLAQFGDLTKIQKLYNCVVSAVKYINYIKNKK